MHVLQIENTEDITIVLKRYLKLSSLNKYIKTEMIYPTKVIENIHAIMHFKIKVKYPIFLRKIAWMSNVTI